MFYGEVTQPWRGISGPKHPIKTEGKEKSGTRSRGMGALGSVRLSPTAYHPHPQTNSKVRFFGGDLAT